MRDYKRNGFLLSKDERRRIEEIDSIKSDICVQFQKNLGEESTKLTFTHDELKGLPDSDLQRLKKNENDENLYDVSLEYPEYFPCMKYVSVPETRRKLEKAFNQRCMEENTEIMEKLVKLRAERANLLGYDSHSDYVLEVRMAKNSKNVLEFLNDLSEKLDGLAEMDRKALLSLKESECKEMGIDFDGKLNMWDMNYYRRLREEREFGVDHEAIRKYFPIDVVITGLFHIYQVVFSVKFEKVENAHVWHDEVELYNVFDNESKKLLGQFYLDLYPRKGKYGHAAVFGLIPGCDDLINNTRQLPVCSMVCNFTKSTPENPSLLTHNEVVTFFHEFGHQLHQICTTARYARFAGTRVERDFVEAPSQMLENWCYEKEALLLMSGHVDDNSKKLPSDLLDSLINAKNANAGVLNKRQLVFGLFDQEIHRSDEADTAKVYAQVLKDVSNLDATPDTNFAAGFGHLAGGYDSGYYGYLYSQVFSADMFYSRFKKEGILNPVIGREYRDTVLAPSGSVDSIDSITKFIGRKPNMEAFLISNGFK